MEVHNVDDEWLMCDVDWMHNARVVSIAAAASVVQVKWTSEYDTKRVSG